MFSPSQASSTSVACGTEEARSVLVKAGDLLAPDSFVHTLERPAESGLKQSSGVVHLEQGRKLKDYELAKQQVEEHAKTIKSDDDRER